MIKDDQHDPEVALRVDQELIDAGVVAIIGHMTSAMSVVAVPLMNRELMLMISPTTSTSRLTGIDDFFSQSDASQHTPEQSPGALCPIQKLVSCGDLPESTISPTENFPRIFCLILSRSLKRWVADR